MSKSGQLNQPLIYEMEWNNLMEIVALELISK